MVVIRGPEATAGSIFIFLKNIGTVVPTKLDITIDMSKDIPTHPETQKENNGGLDLKTQTYKPINKND